VSVSTCTQRTLTLSHGLEGRLALQLPSGLARRFGWQQKRPVGCRSALDAAPLHKRSSRETKRTCMVPSLLSLGDHGPTSPSAHGHRHHAGHELEGKGLRAGDITCTCIAVSRGVRPTAPGRSAQSAVLDVPGRLSRYAMLCATGRAPFQTTVSRGRQRSTPRGRAEHVRHPDPRRLACPYQPHGRCERLLRQERLRDADRDDHRIPRDADGPPLSSRALSPWWC
jgi:hypothetical protein